MYHNIKEVPVANERLFKETALETGEDRNKVEDIIKHMSKFIAGTMKAGMMEGVMIPEFGKFQPKQKVLLAKNKVLANQRSGMDLLHRAITGKKLIDKREKPSTDETI